MGNAAQLAGGSSGGLSSNSSMSFQGSFQRFEVALEIARQHCRSMEDFLSYKLGRNVGKPCPQGLPIVRKVAVS